MATSTALPAALVARTRPLRSSTFWIRAVLQQHHVFFRIVVIDAVLELVGDDPHIVKARVLDGDAKRRIGKIGDLDLIVGERRDHRRRPDIVHRIDRVGLAEMPGKVFFHEPDRGPVPRRHPCLADLKRRGDRAGQRCRAEAGAGDFQSVSRPPAGAGPPWRGALRFQSLISDASPLPRPC